MPIDLEITHFVSNWIASPFSQIRSPAWQITQSAKTIIRAALEVLGDDYLREGDAAVHRSTIVETGAVLKGPAILGPNCFVAAGAYLRDGVYLAERCIVGPGSELKTTFMFDGSKLAHFNFVGDSILGADINVEAGAIIANYRNELDDKTIWLRSGDVSIKTDVDKFGSLIGDGVRIGANAVLAPGTVLQKGMKVPRLSLVDQYLEPRSRATS